MASAQAAPTNDRTEALPWEEQSSQNVNPNLEGTIRQRAHEIYLQRGGQDGSDLEDWLQAEQETVSQHGLEASASEN